MLYNSPWKWKGFCGFETNCCYQHTRTFCALGLNYLALKSLRNRLFLRLWCLSKILMSFISFWALKCDLKQSGLGLYYHPMLTVNKLCRSSNMTKHINWSKVQLRHSSDISWKKEHDLWPVDLWPVAGVGDVCIHIHAGGPEHWPPGRYRQTHELPRKQYVSLHLAMSFSWTFIHCGTAR